MFQDISWKPGDATKLIKFHQQFAPDIEAARPTPAQDARCKACKVEYLKGELSADGLCRHCADEHNAAFYDMSQDVGGFYDQDVVVREPLPLATPVRIPSLGVNGVISAHNPNDSSRVRVTWFDRHFWIVRHKFFDIAMVQALENTTASL